MSDYTTKATVELDVNGQKAKQGLEQQRKLVKDLEIAYAKAEVSGDKSAKTIYKELLKARRELKTMQSATVNVADVLRRLDNATPKELKSTLRQLNKELNSIQRGADAWNAHVDKIRAVKKEIDSVNSTLATQRTRWQKLGDYMSKWQTMAVAAFAVVMKFESSARQAVNAYVEMDSAMANTRKFTGMTREEVEFLNEEFKGMDTRTTREGLNELAQAAGRLGKKSVKDVMEFVRAGDIIGVAMDELGTEVPEIISKLAGIFNLEAEMGAEKAMLSVGSAINTLSQNYAAASPELVDFSSRMGATASQTNMAMHEMLAFGTLLAANNVSIEKSSTAMQGVISKMYASPATFAKKAGLDVNAFTESLKRSSTEGVMMFINTLSQMDQMQLNATLKDLGSAGSGVTQTFQTLAGKSADLKAIMIESETAFKQATSATEEFNVQNNTAQAGLDKAKNTFNEYAVELGEKLAPIMKHVISSKTIFLKIMNSVITFVGKYKVELAILTASIVTYNIAVHASTIKTKALATVQGIVKAATMAWTAVTYLSATAVASLSGNVTRATAAFRLFSRTLKLSPIGLLVASATAVAGGLTLWVSKSKQLINTEKTLNEIRSKANEKLAAEKTHIDLLVAAARNETLSLDDRKKAIDKLNRIVPNYNALLDETTGKYKANDKALKDYMTTLLRSYELEGAKAELISLGEEKARLKIKEKEVNANIKSTKDLVPVQTKFAPKTSGGAVAPATFNANIGIRGHLRSLNNTLNDINHQLSVIESKEKAIKNAYGLDLLKAATQDSLDDDGDDDGTCPKCGKKPCRCPEFDPEEKRFAAEKTWRERMDLENKLAHRRGLKDFEEYMTDKENIEEQYYIRVLARKDLTESERLKFDTELEEARFNQTKRAAELNTQLIGQTYQEQMRIAKQSYLDGILDAEAFADETERIELERMHALVLITESGSEERLKAEQTYQDALVAQRKRLDAKEENRKRKEAEAAMKREKDITDMRRKYFGLSAKEAAEVETNALTALDEAYAWELAGAGDDAEAIEKVKKQYAAARAAMEKEFADPSWLDKVKGRIGSTPFDGIIEMFLPEEMDGDMRDTIMNFAASAFEIYGSVTNMMVAETEIQIAAIERRYEKEISLAEGNAHKVKMLEKQKEKEIAKAKSDANRKQFAMQVIQATAQTAQNAIAAYGSAAAIPLTGHILAPIAAAAAVAAGLLQIAAIKKQQQASEAQGYWMGGFTPAGGKYEPAGIVHKGEWVASQELLASPVARPMIEALDYAQRTNTIGSLSSTDVSRAVIASGFSGDKDGNDDLVQALTAQTSAMKEYSLIIRRLNQRLNEPFVTINTVTGDAGIKKAQEEYDKMINNKRPKHRKK